VDCFSQGLLANDVGESVPRLAMSRTSLAVRRSPRHCERSEAIHLAAISLLSDSWIASSQGLLAMTSARAAAPRDERSNPSFCTRRRPAPGDAGLRIKHGEMPIA